MNWLWIVGGALIVIAFFGALVAAMAQQMGWKIAIGVLASAVGMTAVLTAAALMIGYGVQGHL